MGIGGAFRRAAGAVGRAGRQVGAETRRAVGNRALNSAIPGGFFGTGLLTPEGRERFAHVYGPIASTFVSAYMPAAGAVIQPFLQAGTDALIDDDPAPVQSSWFAAPSTGQPAPRKGPPFILVAVLVVGMVALAFKAFRRSHKVKK